MQLEMHQLEMRYEQLRRRNPSRERQLLASLEEFGQQQPVVVVMMKVSEAPRWVLIDGYKRARLLRRLRQDTVEAVAWDVEESVALMLDQLMRSGDAQDALQQGWLLRELSDRFGLEVLALAQRFDKSASWISRRLGLVKLLPSQIQDDVRAGRIAPHAAMKYLLPLARANAQVAATFSATIAPLRLSTRQVGVLYAGWTSGTDKSRELILSNPRAFLRAHEQAVAEAKSGSSPTLRLLGDLEAIGQAAQRTRRRLAQGLWPQMMAADRQVVRLAGQRARSETMALFDRMDKEDDDVGPGYASRDSSTA